MVIALSYNDSNSEMLYECIPVSTLINMHAGRHHNYVYVCMLHAACLHNSIVSINGFSGTGKLYCVTNQMQLTAPIACKL